MASFIPESREHYIDQLEMCTFSNALATSVVVFVLGVTTGVVHLILDVAFRVYGNQLRTTCGDVTKKENARDVTPIGLKVIFFWLFVILTRS